MESDQATTDSSEENPSSSASIPHEGLESGALRVPLGKLLPSLLVAGLAAVTAAAMFVSDAPGMAAACAFVAGCGGARAILMRRRHVVLRSDRIIESGLVSSTELRLSKIDAVKVGKLPLQKTLMKVSPSSLIYRGEAGAIAFDSLAEAGATRMSQAVLAVVGPRLVQKAARTIVDGGLVRFGRSVHADKRGITRSEVGAAPLILSWNEVDHVEVTPGGIRVFAIDRPDRVIVVPIDADNAILLGDLVEEMRDGRTASAGAATVAGWAEHHDVGGVLVCGIDRASNLGPGLAVGAGAVMAAVVPLTTDPAVQVVAGFASVAIAAAAGVTLFQRRRRAFAVYEHGIADVGGFMAFKDVAHVQRVVVDRYGRRGFVARHVEVVFTANNGRKIKLVGANDQVEAVATAALRRLMPELSARARRSISHGNNVVAGPIAINKRGIVGADSTVIAWDDLASAEVVGAMLHLKRTGDDQATLLLPLAVPDALVVAEIIDGHLRERAEQRESEALPRELFRADDAAVEVAVDVESIIRR